MSLSLGTEGKVYSGKLGYDSQSRQKFNSPVTTIKTEFPVGLGLLTPYSVLTWALGVFYVHCQNALTH